MTLLRRATIRGKQISPSSNRDPCYELFDAVQVLQRSDPLYLNVHHSPSLYRPNQLGILFQDFHRQLVGRRIPCVPGLTVIPVLHSIPRANDRTPKSVQQCRVFPISSGKCPRWPHDAL